METMKVLLLFLIGITVIVALTDEEIDVEFEKFKKEHPRTYDNAYQEGERKKIFAANLRKIEANNKKYEEASSSHREGVDPWTDLLDEEVDLIMGIRRDEQ